MSTGVGRLVLPFSIGILIFNKLTRFDNDLIILFASLLKR